MQTYLNGCDAVSTDSVCTGSSQLDSARVVQRFTTRLTHRKVRSNKWVTHYDFREKIIAA